MTEQNRLEQEILRLLAQRGTGQTICPSEVARVAARSDNPVAWEPLMDPVRKAALALVAARRIVITQRGRIVDGATATGPIRLRLR
jgi:hypothetical protein